MKNQSFYAFYPKDFDPRNEPNFKIDSGIAVWKRLNQITATPPDEHLEFTKLAYALFHWAVQQPDDEEDIRVLVERDRHFYYDNSAKFFHLDMIPSYQLETWYLYMIENANQLGLIVYSDFDESFYFPDGTSEPATAREWLKQLVINQNTPSTLNYETILEIIEQEKSEPERKTLNPYLNNKKDLEQAIIAIVEHYLEQYKIQNYKIHTNKIEGVKVVFDWADTEIILSFINTLNDFEKETFNNPKVSISFSYTIMANNPIYASQLPKLGHWSSTIAKLFIMTARYDIGELRLNLPLDKRWNTPELERAISQMKAKQVIYSVRQLQADIYHYFTILNDTVLVYKDLYELFDSIIKGHNQYISKYYWQLPQNNDGDLGSIIYIARYLQYPSLDKVIDRVLTRLAEENVKINKPLAERLEHIFEGYDPNFYQK